MTEHDIQRAAALSKIIREIPKQLEKMADGWEANAREMSSDMNAREEVEHCAKELRAYVATWREP